MEEKQVNEEELDEMMEEANVELNAVEPEEENPFEGVVVKALRKFADEQGNMVDIGETVSVSVECADKLEAAKVVCRV